MWMITHMLWYTPDANDETHDMDEYTQNMDDCTQDMDEYTLFLMGTVALYRV